MDIEKGIPVPDAWRNKKGESKYPWKSLDVGDSFVVKKEHRKSWAFIFAAVLKAQKDHGIKLTTRLVDEGTRRIWRVS